MVKIFLTSAVHALLFCDGTCRHIEASICNKRRSNLTTRILNESHKKEETMLPGPQRTANNTPIFYFDRRGMETQTSTV
jgi:hypothetical protein